MDNDADFDVMGDTNNFLSLFCIWLHVNISSQAHSSLDNYITSSNLLMGQGHVSFISAPLVWTATFSFSVGISLM